MAFVHGTPLDLAAAVAEALNGTAFAPLKATLPAADANANSSPSLLARLGNLLRHIMLELDTEFKARRDGTLTICVRPGRYRDSGGTEKLFEGAELQALTDAATNYVYIDASTNTLTINTSGFPATDATYIPIAQYVCAGGAITTEDWEADRRGWLRYWPNASSTSPAGTDGSSFTVDQDNTGGAGAGGQYRVERGTTDAEDACLEWDETNDRWRARSQHSTLTYAAFDLLAIYISGTLMFDANGATKVAADVAGDGLSHASGVLAVNPDGSTLEINSDAVRIKDAGVTAAKLSDAVADKLVQISIADASGATPRTVTIQAKDIQGNNLAEVIYVIIGVYDSGDGGALSTNATLSDGGAGSVVQDWGAAIGLSANKLLVCKTDATGLLEIALASGVNGTFYVLSQAGPRSRMLDCADIGTVVIS